MREKESLTLTIGRGTVVLMREGSSGARVGNILGTEESKHGQVETIWVDRMMHSYGERIIGWHAEGAISSIFRRAPAKAEQEPRR